MAAHLACRSVEHDSLISLTDSDEVLVAKMQSFLPGCEDW